MNNTDSIKAHHFSSEELIVEAVRNNEGIIASNGAFSTSTGERTGRSPNDRFIVQESTTSDLIDWGDINKPFKSDKFDLLWNKVDAYLKVSIYEIDNKIILAPQKCTPNFREISKNEINA